MNRPSKTSKRSKVIASLLLCLLPVVIGLFLYPRLPDEIPVLFNFSGQADSWWPKLQVIFVLPLILTLLDAVALFATFRDNQKDHLSHPVMNFLYWLIPGIELVIMCVLYLYALDVPLEIDRLIPSLVGLLLILLGNLLPKAKQNSVFGIRTSWSMEDPENWIQSNRFGSRVIILAGLAGILISLFVRNQTLAIVLPLVLYSISSILPIYYSWRFARKKKAI